MNISKITSNCASTIKKAVEPASKYVNKAADGIGGAVEKSKIAQKIIDKYEANGADNSFFGLATIMVCFVLVPRIASALKRNPDDKEKTKDEIVEILFRDIQTILIMLFGLKSMNTIVSNLSTKLTGIPMVNKAYKPIINNGAEGIGNKILTGIKNFSSNIADTLNPIGGSVSHSGETITSKFTNYNSIEAIQKFIKNIPNEGGKSEKVFNKMMDGVIQNQDEILNGNTKKGIIGLIQKASRTKNPVHTQIEIENAKSLKNSLIKIKKDGVENFLQNGTKDENVQNALTAYFKDENNSLALGANIINAILKTVALGIEVVYLGFGLPALNIKRLEKKYLSEKPIGTVENGNFNPFNDKHIKAQEIKLYSNFLK